MALIYFALRSASLDDWDSVQFAQGIGGFNLFLHHPHPPGYPLYIFSGWLLTHVGLSAPIALMVISALGGGLFVGAWFHLLSERFGHRIAWPSGLALAAMAGVWMTATKVLTDAPASGLLALEILFVLRGMKKTGSAASDSEGANKAASPVADFYWAAIAGAAAAGFRPQNIGVVLIILIAGLTMGRMPRRAWAATIALLIGGCALWLVPMLWTQQRLPQATGGWFSYAQQVWAQWRWRFDKPQNYLLAGDGSAAYLWDRFDAHILQGWFANGLGWLPTSWPGMIALPVWGAGWILYLRGKFWRKPQHRAFWIFQAWWAPLYVAMIFITLPNNTRYYLPIYPLLLLGGIAGWQRLAESLATVPAKSYPMLFANLVAWSIPAFTFLAVVPHIADNACELAPPVRVLQSLKQTHPALERPRVWLYLTDSLRHGEYYAPEFHLASWPKPGSQADCEREAAFAQAIALYTDDRAFLERTGWSNVQLVKFQKASRRKIIHNKHSSVTLYKIQRITKAR